MSGAGLPGTAGYGESADSLVGQYEGITFEDVHRDVLHLMPAAPGAVMDIGAGTGRDAGALAARGHTVVAVEPTPELRAHGRRLHPSPRITWIDDGLPDLSAVMARAERFDLILLTAVWMHLDAAERVTAMERVAGLLRPGGRVSLSLRHGPVPAGRRMFDVPAGETVDLGRRFGLEPLHAGEREDMLGRADVRWSFVVLARAL
ncbi:class I SAM-dependent methyltransferase [Azospirillum sp.]|uniref:class I SAM-dependent methyltransferase n=1 Tax=Azospirillum sp. TaxID=34012 RepID=UPI003D7075BD